MQTSSLNGFLLPLTFGNIRSSTHSDSSLTSFQNATPTCMKTWTRRVGGEGEQVSTGIVIGCEDGTLYVLGHSPPTSSISAAISPSIHAHVVQPAPIRSSARYSRNSLQNSRSSSPSTSSLNSAPYIVAPRAHVVSSVNREQVEAPKNYVDFDDEPDKLKDMLKGKARSNKLASDNSSEKTVSVTSPTSPNTPAPVLEPSPRKDLSRSRNRNLLEAYTSTNLPQSFSIPSSPNYHTTFDADAADYMNILCHIVPSTIGNSNTVKSVLVLANASICLLLQESGHLYVVSMLDGQCLARAQAKVGALHEGPVSKDLDSSYNAYVWQNLQIITTQQATYIVASASNHESPSASTFEAEDSNQERAFSVVYELIPSLQIQDYSLEFLGYWELDCVCNTLTILTGFNGHDIVAYISSEGTLSMRGLKVLPELPASPASPGPEANSRSISTHLHISNPFKTKSKSSSSEHLHENKTNVKVLLDELQPTHPLSLQDTPSGLRLRCHKSGTFAIAWTATEIRLLHLVGGSYQLLYQDSVHDIQSIHWLDDFRYAVIFEAKAEIYVLRRVDADNDAVKNDQTRDGQYYPNLEKVLLIDQWDAVACSSSTELLTVTKTTNGRQIQAWTWGDESRSNIVPTIIFNASLNPPEARITALLPLDVGTMIQGNTDGYLRVLSLEQMCHSNNASSEFLKISDRPLNGYVTGLHFVINYRTRERYIFGGADDGTVAIWTVGGLELCGRWVVFNTALDKVIQFTEEKSGPFYGCVLCVAEDGAIAIVAIDGFQFLYLIPGASADLESICLEGNNLLLIYADRQCRIWDAQTKEFRRSMGVDKVHELFDHGGWTRVDLAHIDDGRLTVWDVPVRLPQSSDAASTLSLRTEQFITDTVAMAKTISTSRDQTRAILQSLDRLRVVLSAILTFGLSPDVDSICKGKLGVTNLKISVGFAGSSSLSFYDCKESREVWCISGDVTASRLLGIVLLLKAIGLFEEYTEAANSIIIFYTTSLAACVGPHFIPPSLPYLASLWFQGSYELRHAIRIVFDATLFGMSDEEAISTIDHWQGFVPCLQPDSERESLTTALALFICGYIAAEKYSFVSAPVLRDISKSISLYLLDETSSYRVLAIDLCSRGFNVWQYYIDAMEILRSLFMLATTTKKNDISIQNVGAHARSSVLLIATNNTPLFMSTLGVDILTPPSLEHRRSVLQIVAFLIRKRPSVLQPNLPKLMEAVVKSLDPNNTTNREAVIDTATEIIGYVVKTFPTVDFHMTSQRLAVGTHEGAVIMYDLKTAIRLFVLEGHKKDIAAVSFSPDGRRLVTLSVEESVVLVWKVGTSFISFFNPGAPPSQGNSGGKPFKTFPFKLGDEVVMSNVEALTQISFEWLGDRSVRLRIRDSTLTFSTG